MAISILVTLIQNDGALNEVRNMLLVAKLPSPLAGACLSQEQALELWSYIQPELNARDLAETLDYKLRLLFLVDGVPTFEQTWSHWPTWPESEGQTSLKLPSGGKLWITFSWDATVRTVTLEH